MGKLGKRIMACLSASLVVMSLAGCSVGGGGNGGIRNQLQAASKGKTSGLSSAPLRLLVTLT